MDQKDMTEKQLKAALDIIRKFNITEEQFEDDFLYGGELSAFFQDWLLKRAWISLPPTNSLNELIQLGCFADVDPEITEEKFPGKYDGFEKRLSCVYNMEEWKDTGNSSSSYNELQNDQEIFDKMAKRKIIPAKLPELIAFHRRYFEIVDYYIGVIALGSIYQDYEGNKYYPGISAGKLFLVKEEKGSEGYWENHVGFLGFYK